MDQFSSCYHWMSGVLLVSLAIAVGASNIQDSCIGPATFENASRCCKERGSNSVLARVTDHKSYLDMADMMRQMNVTSSWLSIRRQQLDTYEWINGTPLIHAVCQDQGYEDARRCCAGRGRGYHLAVIQSKEDYRDVIQKMQAQNKTKIWLPIRKQIFHNYTWLSGKLGPVDFIKQNWPHDTKCVKWSYRERQLQAGKCHDSISRGSLCQKTECNGCMYLELKQTSKCQKVGKTCYVRDCTKQTWTGATVFCTENSLELAVLDTKIKMRQMKNISWPLDHACADGWVGLRREDWKNTVNESVSENLRVSHLQLTDSATGECVVMRTKGKQYIWEPSDCRANAGVLCVGNANEKNYPSLTTFKKTVTVIEVTSPERNLVTRNDVTLIQNMEGHAIIKRGLTFLYTILPAILLACLITTFSVMWLVCRFRINKKEVDSGDDEQTPGAVDDARTPGEDEKTPGDDARTPLRPAPQGERGQTETEM